MWKSVIIGKHSELGTHSGCELTHTLHSELGTHSEMVTPNELLILNWELSELGTQNLELTQILELRIEYLDI